MSEVLRESRIWVPLPTLVYQGRIASFDTEEWWWRDIGKFLLDEAKGVGFVVDRMGERSCVDFERLMVLQNVVSYPFFLEHVLYCCFLFLGQRNLCWASRRSC
mgnify:FL=1